MHVEEAGNPANNLKVFLKIRTLRIERRENLKYFVTKEISNEKCFSRFCRTKHGLSFCIFFFR